MPSPAWNLKRWTKDFHRFKAERPNEVYGLHWGDPEHGGSAAEALSNGRYAPGPLGDVVTTFIDPFMGADVDVLEIGSGGGRWTRYLLGGRSITCVDINPLFEAVLAEVCAGTTFRFYRSGDYELGGIASGSIDFVFSFGTFVHIEPDGIKAYLKEIERTLRAGGVAVIHYADKTKPRAAAKNSFTNMNPSKMERFVSGLLRVEKHETELLDHSNIIVIRK